MKDRTSFHTTHAIAALHLRGYEPQFPDVTGYCIDAPELMPAGSARCTRDGYAESQSARYGRIYKIVRNGVSGSVVSRER